MARVQKKLDESTFLGRFAVRLRVLRENTGMDVYEIAEAYGFARTSFYDWENGRRTPPLEKLPRIAAALGVSVRNLLPER